MPERTMMRQPVSIRFRSVLMNQVRERAKAEGKSLNETMSQLVESGLSATQHQKALAEMTVEIEEIRRAILKLIRQGV